MMITLLGSMLGFIGAMIPEILKIFTDTADRKHEITILSMQMEQQKSGYQQRLEEIRNYADIKESDNLYKTFYSGVKWVDALNATVRPVLAYSFFILYAAVKGVAVTSTNSYELFWNEEDQAIFSGIISFYFGQRAIAKLRKS